MKLLILSLLITITSLTAQFKYSAGLGLGATFNVDVDSFNTSISDSGLKKIKDNWLPLEYDFSIQVYPSLRLGYFKLSNALIPNKSSEKFFLVIIMRGVSVQTFFTFLRRFEANFGLVPLLAKAEFVQEFTSKTSQFQFSTSTQAGTKNSAVGLYSWIGLRFYLASFIALEGNIGYLRVKFKGGNWKSEGEGNGVSGKIDLTKPFFRFGIVLGW